jgi:hypothetical protein
MLLISHRVNTAAILQTVPVELGVEVDIRDRGSRLIVQHDPFCDGEDFEEYLESYRLSFIILNVKSERIEHRIRPILEKRQIKEYFFLDCSFPMLHALSTLGEQNVAVRFSEYEPVEAALRLAGRVNWVWADCFTKQPFDHDSYNALKKHFKLCVVSPELQGRSTSSIPDFAAELKPFKVDAICTKAPEVWKSLLQM